ncbi:hypothetical protein OPT61_g6262 [Boeremia exigua]|uniref:Uncharacterized protein n=1 Tax=Boeremia exigua TaxID=749465 RepID=A0ACC2I778_9PLEO|nr:hypothetical protein OPT61_g6262 [Boeremia exigua]
MPSEVVETEKIDAPAFALCGPTRIVCKWYIPQRREDAEEGNTCPHSLHSPSCPGLTKRPVKKPRQTELRGRASTRSEWEELTALYHVSDAEWAASQAQWREWVSQRDNTGALDPGRFHVPRARSVLQARRKDGEARLSEVGSSQHERCVDCTQSRNDQSSKKADTRRHSTGYGSSLSRDASAETQEPGVFAGAVERPVMGIERPQQEHQQQHTLPDHHSQREALRLQVGSESSKSPNAQIETSQLEHSLAAQEVFVNATSNQHIKPTSTEDDPSDGAMQQTSSLTHGVAVSDNETGTGKTHKGKAKKDSKVESLMEVEGISLKDFAAEPAEKKSTSPQKQPVDNISSSISK